MVFHIPVVALVYCLCFFKAFKLLKFFWCAPPLLTGSHQQGYLSLCVTLESLQFRASPLPRHLLTIDGIIPRCFHAQHSSLSETACAKFTEQLTSSHAVHTNSFALEMKTNWCPLELNLLKHTLQMTHMNGLNKWNRSLLSDPISDSPIPPDLAILSTTPGSPCRASDTA